MLGQVRQGSKRSLEVIELPLAQRLAATVQTFMNCHSGYFDSLREPGRVHLHDGLFVRFLPTDVSHLLPQPSQLTYVMFGQTLKGVTAQSHSGFGEAGEILSGSPAISSPGAVGRTQKRADADLSLSGHLLQG
jgi:hypothetical protein